MGADTHEYNRVILYLINQQKVSADVTFAIVGPFAFQRVIKPLRPERGIVCNQQQHHIFESYHIVAARVRYTRPVFEK